MADQDVQLRSPGSNPQDVALADSGAQGVSAGGSSSGFQAGGASVGLSLLVGGALALGLMGGAGVSGTLGAGGAASGERGGGVSVDLVLGPSGGAGSGEEAGGADPSLGIGAGGGSGPPSGGASAGLELSAGGGSSGQAQGGASAGLGASAGGAKTEEAGGGASFSYTPISVGGGGASGLAGGARAFLAYEPPVAGGSFVLGGAGGAEVAHSYRKRIQSPPTPARSGETFLSMLRKDQFRNTFPTIKVFLPNDDYDVLYLEPTSSVDFTRGEVVKVPAYIRSDPQKQLLKKFGIEGHRAIAVEFERKMAEAKGLSIQRLFGAVVFHEKEPYRLTDAFRRDYVNQAFAEHTSASVIAFGVKVRPSAFDDISEQAQGLVAFGVKLRPSLTETVEDMAAEQTQMMAKPEEFESYSRYQAELYEKSFQPIHLYFLKDPYAQDLLYGESTAIPEFTQYPVPSLITTGDDIQRSLLRRFGVEKWRGLNADFSLELLRQRNVPPPVLGTLFGVEGEFYTITSILPADYFGNTGQYARLSCLASKNRPSSLLPDVTPDARPETTFWLTPADLRIVAELQADLYRVAITNVEFIDRDFAANFDPLYLEEAQDYMARGIRYLLPAFVNLEPNRATLKKYGIESERNIQITLPRILAEADMPTVRDETQNRDQRYPNIGTLVVFEGELYQVTWAKRAHYFGSTERYLTRVLFAKKLRSSSYDEGDVTHPNAVPDRDASRTIETPGPTDPGEDPLGAYGDRKV